jgi:FKBP-type peptidyl-prolyl cis-trans isomerase FkpA
MKKITVITLCAGLFLASCGEAPPDETAVESAPVEAMEPEMETETEGAEMEPAAPEPAVNPPTAAPKAVEERAPAMETTASGLKYEVLELGEGTMPTLADTVTVHYRGELLDGSVFDSSYDRGQPTSFPLARVVEGWKEGLQLMPVGSKYRFEIPPALGYGERGAGPIPPNSTLIFYVELLGIQ